MRPGKIHPSFFSIEYSTKDLTPSLLHKAVKEESSQMAWYQGQIIPSPSQTLRLSLTNAHLSKLTTLHRDSRFLTRCDRHHRTGRHDRPVDLQTDANGDQRHAGRHPNRLQQRHLRRGDCFSEARQRAGVCADRDGHVVAVSRHRRQHDPGSAGLSDDAGPVSFNRPMIR